MKKTVSVLLCSVMIFSTAFFTAVCETKPNKIAPPVGNSIYSEEKVTDNSFNIQHIDTDSPVSCESSPACNAAVNIKVSDSQSDCSEVRDTAKASAAYLTRSSLNKPSQLVYDTILQLSNDIISGATDAPFTDWFNIIPAFTDTPDSYYITREELGVSVEDAYLIPDEEEGEGYYLLPPNIKQVLSDKLVAQVDMAAIHSAMLADNPYEFFWYNKNEGIKILSSSYYTADFTHDDIGFDKFGNPYLLRIKVEYVKILTSLTVSEDYFGYKGWTISNGYSEFEVRSFNPELLSTRVYPAKARADAIIEKHKNESDSQKLKSYHDEICALTDYDTVASQPNTTVPYGDPWQMISVFDNDKSTKVVCEGYAKAFKYLCDNSVFDDKTLTCNLVNGELYENERCLGGHMWNVLNIGNKNYLVDVTNDDSNNTTLLFVADPVMQDKNGIYYFSYVASKYLGYKYETESDSDENLGYNQKLLFGEERLKLDVKYELGDVNMDKSVNVSDCVKLKIASGNLSFIQKKLADVSGDGVLNDTDTEKIAKYIARKISAF